MADRFSSDLWYSILSYCASNRPTLLSALRVNITIYTAAGKLLYRKVKVDNIPNFLSGSDLPPLKNTKSPLLQYVQELHLQLRSFTAHEFTDPVYNIAVFPHIDPTEELLRFAKWSAEPPASLPLLKTLALGYTCGEDRLYGWSFSRTNGQRVNCPVGFANSLFNQCKPRYACTNPDDDPLGLSHRAPDHLPEIITWHVMDNSSVNISWFWGIVNRIYLFPRVRAQVERCRSTPDRDVDWLRGAFHKVKLPKKGASGNGKKTTFEIYLNLKIPGTHGEPVESSVRERITRTISRLLDRQMKAQVTVEGEQTSLESSGGKMAVVEVIVEAWDRRPACPSCGDGAHSLLH